MYVNMFRQPVRSREPRQICGGSQSEMGCQTKEKVRGLSVSLIEEYLMVGPRPLFFTEFFIVSKSYLQRHYLRRRVIKLVLQNSMRVNHTEKQCSGQQDAGEPQAGHKRHIEHTDYRLEAMVHRGHMHWLQAPGYRR